jgi:hypothetical protein
MIRPVACLLACLACLACLAWPCLTAAQAEAPMRVRAAPADVVEDNAVWVERLTGLFAEGVLTTEAKRSRGVVKWRGPVDVSIRGDAAARYVPALEDLLQELSRLTGLEMDLAVDQNWAGHIDIYVTDLDFYRPFFFTSSPGRGERFTCAAMPWAIDGEMKRSTIRINAGAVGERSAGACIVEEVVQSLGLLGESDAEVETVLHDRVGYLGLGVIDRLLLRTLYDARLEPGMSGEEALPLARAILTENLARMRCEEVADGRARRCRL